MKFAVVGISYKEADESIRQHTVFMDSVKIALYEQCVSSDIQQVVFLSTCNRSECYLLFEDDCQLQRVKELFQQQISIPILPYLYEKQEQDAYLHLFEVAAGYHSMVIGEDQIEGQLQDAYRFACDMQACGKQLHWIFQSCFRTIKQIKTTYQISASPLSIPYIAMQYLKQQTSLDGKRVLVIGSGSMAELMLTYLKQEPIQTLYLCNRHLQRALALLNDERMQLISFEQRYSIANDCDIVISATSSPHEILVKECYASINAQLLVDLAMPRDIDPAIQDEQHALLGIDDFAKVRDSGIERRKELLAKARTELITGVEETMMKMQQEPVQQLISSLHRKSEEHAEAALSLISRKITLSHHEQRLLDKILRSSFHRMVREPMRLLSTIKDQQDELCKLVKQLYDLEDE